jgi:hypothetical protein
MKSHSRSPTGAEDVVQFDQNDSDELGCDIDSTHEAAQAARTTVFDLSAHRRHREGSFFIDDLRRSTPLRNGISTSSESESAASGTSAAILDKRQRIARRMMPAAMLQRLEREAAEKVRERERKRKDANRVRSPARPGRAVVRPGQGAGNIDDLLDFIGSDADSLRSVDDVSRSPILSQRQGIVISDESDGVSSSSQAYEDNAGAQTLARLYDGDFETIIAGKRSFSKGDVNEKRKKQHKEARPRRPKMGFVARGKVTPGRKVKTLHQGRLDFPVEERSPSNRRGSTKKRKHGSARPRHSRPAIRLDDQTIYADADFAFDDGSEVASITSQPRVSKRTPSKVHTTTFVENVDAGSG